MKSGLSFLVAALRSETDELDQLARTSELVGAIGRLVHGIQRERGISNVVLASGGKRFGVELQTQIAESLQLEERVRECFDRLETDPGRLGNGARLFSRIAWVLPGMDALPDLRRRIGTLAMPASDATAAFVKLIAGLLAVVFEAADGATDPEISRLLVAMFNFMQGKEFTGQERACGAAAFTSGRNDSARQQQWLHLIESQERCFQVFSEFSGPELEAQWLANLPPAHTAELERMRRIACAAPAGVALDPELSGPWFDCCTRRIDAMQTIETRLAADLRELCSVKSERLCEEMAAHTTLLTQIATHSPAPVAAAFFDASSDAADAPAGPAANTTLYGRQLERAILEMVQDQSRRLQAMRDELDTVRGALNERKLVERAKGLLMAHRKLSEEDAHKMLRQTAMNQNRRLVDVAESVLAMADFLPMHDRG
ncbi:MAG: nitrate- and nitrite sensing domain-containing protein [Janthinobacterium lividum]